MSKGSLVGAGVLVAVACPAAHAASGPPANPTGLELAAMPAVKLVIRDEGWIRVRQPALVAAGLDPGVDPARLRLFADGVEQSIQFTGNGDSTFGPDEALEFYGVGRDTLWTDAHTYWLVAGDAGRRAPLVANPGGAPPPRSFRFTARLRERKTYYAPLKNGDDSNFFGAVVDGNGATSTLAVHHLDAAEVATVRVVLQGVTRTTHLVAISLNGRQAGTCSFEGQTLATCTLPPANLLEGDNQVGLVAMGTSDFSLVDTVEIDYAHAYTADADSLKMTAPPSTRLAIGGFSSADVRVVDVTDGADPVELVTGMSFDGAAYVATVNTSGATSARTLWAFTEASVRAPSAVAANHPSSWSDALAGDLVILSHADLLESVRPLADRRAQEGWSVQLVDLQDVYDGFGGGDKTAFAIRDFLRYAHDHWRVPPRFVLLVGDASVDPRNFLGLGDFDLAPTKLIDTQVMETASDDWFVDWNDDGVPEVAIGRLPVRTPAEATTVVGKILGYAGVAGLSRGALFVTDQSEDGLDFEAASQQGAAAVSDLMPVDNFLYGQTGSTSAALLAKLDQGPFVVDYTGHGSVAVWDGLFSGDDARALTNQALSIYVSMNCLNGFFQDVYTESLAESLLKAPGGGAVAVWASSTLSSFEPQTVLNREFLGRLTRTSIGEAAIAAKQAITDDDARRTWILFGDPTLFGRPAAAPGDGSAPDGPPPGDAGDAGSRPDAGPPDGPSAGSDADGQVPADGGAPDASPKGPSDGGCGCRVDSGPAVPRGEWLLVLALVAGFRRRRAPGRGPGSSFRPGQLILSFVLSTDASARPSPRRAEGFVSRSIGDETIIVPVRGGVGDLDAIFTLNAVGATIWKLLDGGTPVERLAAAVAAEYEVSEAEAAGDVADFIALLTSKGLLA